MRKPKLITILRRWTEGPDARAKAPTAEESFAKAAASPANDHPKRGDEKIVVPPLGNKPPTDTPPPATPPEDQIPVLQIPDPNPIAPVETPPATPPSPGDADKNFAALRSRMDEEVSRRDAEIQALSERLKDTQGRLAGYNAVEHPDYQKNFVAPLHKERDKFLALGTQFGFTEEEMRDVLTKQPKEALETMAGLHPEAQPMMGPAYGNVINLSMEAKRGLEELQAKLKETGDQADVASVVLSARKKEQVGSLVAETLQRLVTDKFIPLMQVEGEEDWNKQVNSIVSFTSTTLAGENDPLKVKLMMMGATAPGLYKSLVAEQAKVRELQERLGIAHSVAPRGNGAHQAPPGAPVTKAPSAEDSWRRAEAASPQTR